MKYIHLDLNLVKSAVWLTLFKQHEYEIITEQKLM